MSGDLVPGRFRWIALAVVAAVVAVGALRQNPNAALATAGAVFAVLGTAFLVHDRRPQLLYAAVATLTVPTDGLPAEAVSQDILARLVSQPAAGGRARPAPPGR